MRYGDGALKVSQTRGLVQGEVSGFPRRPSIYTYHHHLCVLYNSYVACMLMVIRVHGRFVSWHACSCLCIRMRECYDEIWPNLMFEFWAAGRRHFVQGPTPPRGSRFGPKQDRVCCRAFRSQLMHGSYRLERRWSTTQAVSSMNRNRWMR